MKIYLPIKINGDLYTANTNHVNYSDWRDTNYLTFFEKEIRISHKNDIATVSIDGTEFKDCEIFVPKDSTKDHSFIAVDEDYIPISLKGEHKEDESDEPRQNWIIKWLSRSKISENYYHNYNVDLSIKYLAPKIIWDDDTSSVLTHPNSIRRGSRVLLVGQPGAGKTSFVRYLTQYYLRDIFDFRKSEATPLVFYFQLREFPLKSNEYQTWLEEEEDEVGKCYLKKKTRNGKTIFIFDGLDELNTDDRQKFTAWLNNFIDTRPSLGTIVTSRELYSLNSGIWQTFRKAKLLPFDKNQVDEYCKLIIGDKANAGQFTKVINSNPDLQEFLRNPFSLSLALGMFLLRGSLPFNIGVLCKELVAQLIERWDARRGISRVSKVSIESINSTLGRIAYRLQLDRGAQFRPDYVEDLLPVEVENIGASAILQDLSERTGILVELSPNNWSFSHRYLQDFFCANYLVEKASGLSRELGEHGRDSEWVDVWRQVGQLCQDPEFFALLQNRNTSDAIKSVDRMVSALLSHDGLSKAELRLIIEGLTDEINREESNLPGLKYTDFGAELDCGKLDSDSIKILAKTIVHLNYLKNTTAGAFLLEFLNNNSKNDFAFFTRRILKTHGQSTPKVGLSLLQVHFDVDDKPVK